MERFYLGIPEPAWVARATVPVFVSAVRMRRQRRFARSRVPVGVDSGGFSQLTEHGAWTGTDAEFGAEMNGRVEQLGADNVDFIACRDMMCEPHMLMRTGLTVRDHQKWTLESYATLTTLYPWLPWLPILQGWHVDEYREHFEMYAGAGIDLRAAARVGVGSVCRRQSERDGAVIMHAVADLGVRVHAFGIKVGGLRLYGERIASADSMTWSYIARRRGVRMKGCKHETCSSCILWAHEWYRTRVADVGSQLGLGF